MNDGQSEADRMIEQARAFRPDTARIALGFEARVLARIRALRRSTEVDGLSAAAGLIWRCAAGLALVVLGMGLAGWLTGNLVALNSESLAFELWSGAVPLEVVEGL